MERMRVRVFGVLREVADPEGYIGFPWDRSGTAAEIRVELERHLRVTHPGFPAEVVRDCAVADETSILGDDARIESGAMLAILPPVCGG